MATGTYHKFNYLKFRILEALFIAYPVSLTCKEISDNGDIELKRWQMLSITIRQAITLISQD
jgi:hypothetical protein